MYDMIIIGAGPAGMSAAVYGVRAGKRVLLLEKKVFGGQIVNTPQIENYPGIPQISGFEFANALSGQVKALGVEWKLEEVKFVEKRENVFFVQTNKGEYEGKSVIVATGARNRKLGLPGEPELTGHGVSYCATCDGMFFKGKDVAVNGGGNTALEDAIHLSQYCRHVYLIHRRDSFRGEEKRLEILKEKSNVSFLLNSVISEINGKAQLESIKIITQNEYETVLPISGLFIAIGQEPETEVVEGLLERDEKGYLKATEECKTSVEGMFVAGDCRTKQVRQLTTATADGSVAALTACEYLEQNRL